jgi:putative membrane protein
MKNSNFNPKMIYGLCLAGTVFLTASMSESYAQVNSPTDPRPQTQTQTQHHGATSDADHDDERFVTEVADSNIKEIALGQLAQEKGNSPEVKNFGRTMQEDHMQSMAELAELATAKNITLNSSASTADQPSEEYTKLENLEGEEFEAAYSKLMVKKHKEAIEKFEKASNESDDPEIKRFASERLDVLKSHLEEAEAFMNKGGKDKKDSKEGTERRDSPRRNNLN